MRISKPVTVGQKATLKPVGGKTTTARRAERFRSLSKLPMDLWLKHVVLLAGGLFMMLPFIWMFLSSVKSTEEIFSGSLFALPKIWHWEHYGQAWKKAPFDRFFINSLVMSAGIVAGQLMTSSMAAYVFSWVPIRGRKLLFLLVVSSTIVPFESTMIPSYLVIKELGWINSYAGLIVPSTASVFGIFLLRQFFLTIPKDLMDASRIDGCGHFRTLIQIVLPMSKTVLATLSLFAFLHAWNSYLWPLLITNTANMRTVQVGLRYMIDAEQGTDWPSLMAASTFIILPVLLFFLVSQKYFVRGVMNAGVK
ncbi:carbohydrate ABC transporter permease [Paenibacillus sp. CGMCC 1.16610]|uniref:ABC transporter permease subunit n=1 Tax=Paenibacillus anseongense TaxID=2682845 RepID=A0ABW9U5M3_9BACL|nr:MULTISPECIES: carbohydrate ABC transporter permease [Paenibacillus]MBA2942568.1 carbohydrate ABC transporter permease [Paenibacillus sp. CGMCC 1.16610]MVQ35382.1 ABC transporter permease subunit [Paenibacillus anseongense]